MDLGKFTGPTCNPNVIGVRRGYMYLGSHCGGYQFSERTLPKEECSQLFSVPTLIYEIKWCISITVHRIHIRPLLNKDAGGFGVAMKRSIVQSGFITTVL